MEKPIEFTATNTSPELALRERRFVTDGKDYQISISGNGFEAHRNLTRRDMIAIRDWINGVLTVLDEAAA